MFKELSPQLELGQWPGLNDSIWLKLFYIIRIVNRELGGGGGM